VNDSLPQILVFLTWNEELRVRCGVYGTITLCFLTFDNYCYHNCLLVRHLDNGRAFLFVVYITVDRDLTRHRVVAYPTSWHGIGHGCLSLGARIVIPRHSKYTLPMGPVLHGPCNAHDVLFRWHEIIIDYRRLTRRHVTMAACQSARVQWQIRLKEVLLELPMHNMLQRADVHIGNQIWIFPSRTAGIRSRTVEDGVKKCGLWWCLLSKQRRTMYHCRGDSIWQRWLDECRCIREK